MVFKSTFNKKNCGAVCVSAYDKFCVLNYSCMQVHASKCMRLECTHELSSVVINSYQLLINFWEHNSII